MLSIAGCRYFGIGLIHPSLDIPMNESLLKKPLTLGSLDEMEAKGGGHAKIAQAIRRQMTEGQTSGEVVVELTEEELFPLISDA